MKQQKHNRNWTCQHSNVKSQSCFATKNMNFKLNIKNNTIVSNFTSSRFRLSKVKNSTTPKSSLLFVSKKSNMLNVHYTFIFLKCTIPKTNIIFSDSKKYINIQFCNTTFQTLDFICNIYIFQIARPGFHFEVPNTRTVATNTIPYER